MPKKKSESSPQEKRIPASDLFTTPLTDKQRDTEINYSDAPEVIPAPPDLEIGRVYRPRD